MREGKRRRPPYLKFKGWMVTNGIGNQEMANFLDISESSLSQRINGSGPDFTIDEIRKIVNKYGVTLLDYFYLQNSFQKE